MGSTDGRRVPARPDPLDISARQYFWKLRLAYSKAFELRAYQMLGALPETRVLDLGCSDGTYTAMLHEAAGLHVPVLGGDRAEDPLRTAAARQGTHSNLLKLDACHLPLRSDCFELVLSNGVLAHILPDPSGAVAEVQRVLRPGGRFVFTVPTDRHADYYWSVQLADKLGLSRLAAWRRVRVNRNEEYVSLLRFDAWQQVAERAGLRVTRIIPFSGRAIAVRRSVLGTPLLRTLGALWFLPERLQSAVARLVARVMRRSFVSRSSRPIEASEADYVLFVASKPVGPGSLEELRAG
jgi:SAM-dependent methyltransferase